MDSREFVYEKFADYYSANSLSIPQLRLMEQREFGFLLLKQRTMLRHKNFQGIQQLKRFLSKNVPSDVYHSCAYYENPSFEMSQKGWLGADLVFDIDADHIPTKCDKLHDEWICGKCGIRRKGITPATCPACGGAKFETKTWPCEVCLDSAKNETAKLLEMLDKDFGLSPEETRVFFSGHRGYHVHVEAEEVRMLDTMARKEIVDYITGIGFALPNEQKLEKTKGKRRVSRSSAFTLHDFGWNKRLKTGMRKFVLNATKDDLMAIGIRSDALLRNRKAVLNRCLKEGRWDSVKGVTFRKTWRKIAHHVKELESAKIDTVVTTDLHRLIRMDGTLHGKTGLLKTEFPIETLARFNPFQDAVAFKEGFVKVYVSDVPEFKLGGSVLGPFKNETVEVPTAAAVLLICKGRAEVVN